MFFDYVKRLFISLYELYHRRLKLYLYCKAHLNLECMESEGYNGFHMVSLMSDSSRLAPSDFRCRRQ